MGKNRKVRIPSQTSMTPHELHVRIAYNQMYAKTDQVIVTANTRKCLIRLERKEIAVIIIYPGLL